MFIDNPGNHQLDRHKLLTQSIVQFTRKSAALFILRCDQ